MSRNSVKSNSEFGANGGGRGEFFDYTLYGRKSFIPRYRPDRKAKMWPFDPDAYKTGKVKYLEHELNDLMHAKKKNEQL